MPYLHPHPVDRLYYDAWRFCGCGNPEEIIKLIRRALSLHISATALSNDAWHTQLNERHEFLSGPMGLFIMYWLDAQGYTEHGGNVSSAWLTSEGEVILKLLTNHAETFNQGENRGVIEVNYIPAIDEFLKEE